RPRQPFRELGGRQLAQGDRRAAAARHPVRLSRVSGGGDARARGGGGAVRVRDRGPAARRAPGHAGGRGAGRRPLPPGRRTRGSVSSLARHSAGDRGRAEGAGGAGAALGCLISVAARLDGRTRLVDRRGLTPDESSEELADLRGSRRAIMYRWAVERDTWVSA